MIEKIRKRNFIFLVALCLVIFSISLFTVRQTERQMIQSATEEAHTTQDTELPTDSFALFDAYQKQRSQEQQEAIDVTISALNVLMFIIPCVFLLIFVFYAVANRRHSTQERASNLSSEQTARYNEYRITVRRQVEQ